MKVIAPVDGAAGLELLGVLEEASREFNRTLDIRLRFLDIGVDLVPVRPLHGQSVASGDAWRNRVRQVLERERPSLTIVVGGDVASVSAATESRACGVRTVAFVEREDSPDTMALREADPGVRVHLLGDLEEPGEGRRLVEILVAERAGS